MGIKIYLKEQTLYNKMKPQYGFISSSNDYQLGMNIINSKCTKIENLFEYVQTGNKVFIADNSKNITKILDLDQVSTWEYLVSIGLDIRAHSDEAVMRASGQGYLEVVKYLYSLGVDITELPMRLASGNGHIDVVKYLVSQGS